MSAFGLSRLAVRCVRCGATNGAMPETRWRRSVTKRAGVAVADASRRNGGVRAAADTSHYVTAAQGLTGD
jgi:hypothetical protein